MSDSAAFPDRVRMPVWLIVLLLSEAIYSIYAVHELWTRGALPAPFFYDPTDTFMDYFNTNYWAFQPTRYEIWKSVYPIFTFLIAQIFSTGRCAASAPAAMRDCGVFAVWPLFVFYLIGTGFSATLLERALNPARTAVAKSWILIFVTLTFTLPGMFALERGNYIVIAFAFVAMSIYWQHDWRGACALAVAVNIKQYLLILLFVALIKRRYSWFSTCLFVSLGLNLLGMLLVVNDHYSMLINNMVGFSTGVAPSYFEKLWYTSSLGSWSRTIANSPHVGTQLWGYQTQIAYTVLNAARWASLAFACALGLALCARAQDLDASYICFGFVLCMLVAIDSPGGYAIMLLVPFAGQFVRRPAVRWVPWILVIVLTPFDIPLWPTYQLQGLTFFTHQPIQVTASLTLGSYVRPSALAFLVLYLLRDLVHMPVRAPAAGAESRLPVWLQHANRLFE